MEPPTTAYRGRFAPSPTGPLHLGSLIAALASYLDARHHHGQWLVRMEDLDPPREEAGATSSILTSLERHSLHPDEDVLFQSTRGAAYSAALEYLAASGHLFYCDCTRAELGPGGACNGRCSGRQANVASPRSTRVCVPADTTMEFVDQLQNAQIEALGAVTPDFILQRKDGLIAYQLAVVVDDAFQGITHIVRGADLLDSTPRQIFLQQLLGQRQPRYCHLPVITTVAGQKFSKQNQAPALDDTRATCNLRLALRFLKQQSPPARLRHAPDLLSFAAEHWTPDSIPRGTEVPAASIGLKT